MAIMTNLGLFVKKKRPKYTDFCLFIALMYRKCTFDTWHKIDDTFFLAHIQHIAYLCIVKRKSGVAGKRFVGNTGI